MERRARLTGKRILVVEDDWFIARHVVDALAGAGAAPVGPVATASGALELLEGSGAPDAATLDIMLLDGDSAPVARRLADLGVPFMFLSAVDVAALPPDFAGRPLLRKPFVGPQLVNALAGVLEP